MVMSSIKLQCPKCASEVQNFSCTNLGCKFSAGFPIFQGIPVFVDFDESIFEEDDFFSNNGKSGMKRYFNGKSLRVFLRKIASGSNRAAPKATDYVLSATREMSDKPKILVIGGGTVGKGTEKLYSAVDVELIGVDVYVSPYVNYVADAHSLPFAADTFDAVWIQAVLEHVLDPLKVVSEIWRVLRKDGLVYAETPFMQQVHEGAYDFTRFTLSGHRWLFRDFEEISAGPLHGAGTALQWSIHYFLRSLGFPSMMCTFFSILTSPLRIFNRIGNQRLISDATSAVYFLGRKSDISITPKNMKCYYYSRKSSIDKIAAF